MIRIFRSIRQNLLQQGKVSRYLGYAVGEFLLIVLGILAALQIQNWNERRQDRILEIEILQNMAENLEINIQKLNHKIEECLRDDEASAFVRSVIENKSPFEDAVKKQFSWALNPIETGSPVSVVGYESLKSAGLEIIEDRQIRKEIVHLFEETYAILDDALVRAGKSHTEIIKLRQQHFLREGGYRLTPFDYDALIEDQYFYSWLITIKDGRNYIRWFFENSLEETQRVLELIQAELAELDQ